MCIMEVRVNQHSSTIAQACAHNVGTVVGDLQLFREVLKKRNPAQLPTLDQLDAKLSECYHALINFFGVMVEDEAQYLAPYHTHTHITADECGPVGNERVLEEIAEQDIARASKYETRK